MRPREAARVFPCWQLGYPPPGGRVKRASPTLETIWTTTASCKMPACKWWSATWWCWWLLPSSPWIWSAAQVGDLDGGLPLGTILAWVPRVRKSDPGLKSSIPDCWLLCDGRRITQGPWKDGVTPDLSSARRFLRGGEEKEALELEEDQVKQHKHTCSSVKSTTSAPRILWIFP